MIAGLPSIAFGSTRTFGVPSGHVCATSTACGCGGYLAYALQLNARDRAPAWRHGLAYSPLVMVLIAIELILSGGLVLLVTSGLVGGSRWSGASVLPLFVITIAAAETVVALAIVLTLFRHRRRIDLDDGSEP